MRRVKQKKTPPYWIIGRILEVVAVVEYCIYCVTCVAVIGLGKSRMTNSSSEENRLDFSGEIEYWEGGRWRGQNNMKQVGHTVQRRGNQAT